MSANLLAENERLREENRQLREALGARALTPPEWGLTVSQGRLARLLLSRPLVSRDAAMIALYSDRASDWPDSSILDVMLVQLRRKLRPFGITINTVWGQGWRIVPEVQRQFARAA